MRFLRIVGIIVGIFIVLAVIGSLLSDTEDEASPASQPTSVATTAPPGPVATTPAEPTLAGPQPTQVPPSPTQPEPTAGPPTAVPPTATPVLPDLEVTVEQLLKAYEENELAADRVYKGKVAAITGTVESVNEMLGQRFVILKPDYLSISGVRCHFGREHVEQLVKLKAEQVITLQGKIDGYGLARVEVENCMVKSAA